MKLNIVHEQPQSVGSFVECLELRCVPDRCFTSVDAYNSIKVSGIIIVLKYYKGIVLILTPAGDQCWTWTNDLIDSII